jgi:hypothetical protein
VSEYQYYEFAAIDRPLTEQELEEIGALSTRAEITPTSFKNVYHYGSFRGNPLKMMEHDRGKLGRGGDRAGGGR